MSPLAPPVPVQLDRQMGHGQAHFSHNLNWWYYLHSEISLKKVLKQILKIAEFWFLAFFFFTSLRVTSTLTHLDAHGLIHIPCCMVTLLLLEGKKQDTVSIVISGI